MTTATAGIIPTSEPGLLLRPVRRPDGAWHFADVNIASRPAGVSLVALSVDMGRTGYAPQVISDFTRETEWQRPLVVDGPATSPGAGA